MNVLLVGLGSIGQRHLRNLLKLISDCSVFACRSRGLQIVLNDRMEILPDKKLDDEYRITLCQDLKDAWSHGIDVVFITNPSSLHQDVLLQAAENGCDIFIEKPVSTTLKGMHYILDLCARKKIITWVGYQNRFHPCLQLAQELLEKKGIGDIVGANAEIGEDVRIWHKYENYKSMYACRSDLGGGVILSQIHELDYIPWLLGYMPETVYAVGGQLSNLELDVEDVVSILMKFKRGDKSIPVSVQQDYLQNPPSRKCRIIGTAGKIEFDLLSSEFAQYASDGAEIIKKKFAFERNDMFVKELKLFLHAVKTRQKPDLDLAEGLKSLRIALAAKRSLETGLPEHLPEVL